MNRNLFRSCTLIGAIGALGVLASCGENTVSPKSGMAPSGPSFTATEPLNGPGVCMANDAVAAPTGTIDGVKNGDSPLTATNCTSNDVAIATTTLVSYQLPDGQGGFTAPIPYSGGTVACNDGDPIKLNINARLEETANSARSDIGIWIATDGGNAITGACNHYNLVPGSGGVTNPDNDSCGDLDQGAVVPSFPLGVIDAICRTETPTDTLLHIGSCLGWKEPGADVACPLASQGATENGFRWGTLYANKSKCNCDGFDVPITVNRVAHLEVVKACTPSNDNGTFDLLIDGSNSFANNVSCGGTTGSREVGAGTNVNPGAVHTFGEGDFTTANYTSSYSCVNRVGGASRGTGTSLGPNNITLQPADDVICTYTNVRKATIVIVKDAVPNDAQDFGFTSNIAGNASFNLDDDADGTLSNTQTINNVTPGTYTVTEGATSGWDLTDITCVDPTTNSSGVIGTGVATINLAAGESVTCTYTNTKRPKLTIVKRIQNDHGGTKVVGDFGLATNAGSLTFGSGTADGTNILKYTSNQLTVVPGTYTLTENNVTGYDEGTWSCTGVAGTVVNTFSAGSVQLAAGEVAVCTITNDDQPATLIIIKQVKGAGASFPFTTTGSGLSNFTLSPLADATDSKTFTGLSAGVALSVSETDPAPNYVLTDLGCDNQPVGTYDPAVTKTVNVTLTNGGTVTCTFINEARTTGNTTRTQGFWATHSSLTNKAWFGGSIGGNTFTGVSDKTLCAGPAKDLNTLGRVLGGFWANISQKTTNPSKRTAIDQARMQLVQQLLAAILNNSVFNSVPSGSVSIQQAKDAYCGNDIDAIKAAMSAMAAFNESGDNGVFTPGVSANGKLAKSLADLAYWNTLP